MKVLSYGIIIVSFFISNCFIINNKSNIHHFNSYFNSLGLRTKAFNSNKNPKLNLVCYSKSEDSSESKDHKDLELKLLRQKLFEISEPDCTLEEKYIKASGPGGQKINKSAICDQLIYSNPSGSIKIIIKCKKHRTLMLNRIEATKLLISRIQSIKDKEIMDSKREEFKEAMRNRELSEKSKQLRKIYKMHRAIKKRGRSKIIHESEY